MEATAAEKKKARVAAHRRRTRQRGNHLQAVQAYLERELREATVETDVSIKVGEATLRLPLTVWVKNGSRCKTFAFDCPHRLECRRGGNKKPNDGFHCVFTLLKHATSCPECADPEVSEASAHQLAG